MDSTLLRSISSLATRGLLDLLQRLTVVELPNPQYSVLAASERYRCFTCDHGAVYRIARPTDGPYETAVGDIVHSCLLIGGRGYDLVGAANKCQRGYFLAKAWDCPGRRACFNIPNFDRVVSAGACQKVSIVMPRNSQHVVGMSFQGSDGCIRIDPMQSEQFISPTCCDHGAIGREPRD